MSSPHRTDAPAAPTQATAVDLLAPAENSDQIDSVALAVTLSLLCLGASVNTAALFATYRLSRPKVAGHEYVDVELNRIA